MLIITTMSEDLALNMTFGSFIGEESGVSIVCQLVVIGDLFIAQVSCLFLFLLSFFFQCGEG